MPGSLSVANTAVSLANIVVEESVEVMLAVLQCIAGIIEAPGHCIGAHLH
jgi:hypothetical protein